MKHIFSVLLLSIFALGISAQKTATVKSFTQTTDHIAGTDRRNDLNGVPCALVKVQVVDDIGRVEGNKIGEIIDRGVEKWVYMCKGSRNMRIHLKNHLPVKVMFQDYQINGLESNRVYELVIESPDEPRPDPIKQQKLIINYTPTNAMVLIDSKPYRGNGRIETELPVGEHSYIIAAEGYTTAEGVVKLNEQGARELTERLTAAKTVIYRGDTPKPTPVRSASHSVNGLSSGFRGYIEAGYALGLDYDYHCCWLARVAFGYQFNSHIFTGLGAGVGFYQRMEYFSIPVFANFRYYILNKRISPFVDAKVGYSPEDKGGLYLSPSLGCRFAMGKRMAFTASACLEVQDETEVYNWWDEGRKHASSLGLKIGYEF